MEYNEQKAKDIIKKLNLSPTTLRVWKSRGSIPDKYNIERDRQVDSNLNKRVISILSSRSFRKKSFVSVSYHLIGDALKGSVPLSKSNCTKIKAELIQVKDKAKRFIKNPSGANFHHLVSDDRVVFSTTYPELKRWYSRSSKSKDYDFIDGEQDIAIKNTIVLINMIMF